MLKVHTKVKQIHNVKNSLHKPFMSIFVPELYSTILDSIHDYHTGYEEQSQHEVFM